MRIVLISILTLTSLVLPTGIGQRHNPMPEPGQSLTVSARAGEISRLDGEVWLKRRGDAGLRVLQVGERLPEGDVVTTSQHGRAEWAMHPDSYFQLGQESRARIDSLSDSLRRFDIERGEVFVIVGILDHAGALELDTPHALLTVAKRGSYKIRVAPNLDTEATVVRGELRFVNRLGEAGRVTKRKQVRFYKKAG